MGDGSNLFCTGYLAGTRPPRPCGFTQRLGTDGQLLTPMQPLQKVCVASVGGGGRLAGKQGQGKNIYIYFCISFGAVFGGVFYF